MPNTVQHKRSSTASAVPTGAQLALGELAINTSDGRLFLKKGDGSVVAIGRDASELNAGTVASARLPTIGNITNAGAIGSTANLPVITTTSGVLTTGAFGTGANQFCQGDDKRLGLAAWVNFDGTATSNLTGTYSQSTNVITITCTNHNFIAGQIINVDFTSGTAVDLVGTTVISVANANTLTVTASDSKTASGNVTIYRNSIKAHYNVSSIVDLGVGLYAVNFSTALSDNNYAVIATANSEFAAATLAYEEGAAGTRQTGWCRVSVCNSSFVAVDRSRVSVAVYR